LSYLSRPRIGFFSTNAMTNPSTANNENVVHLLDYDSVQLLNPPVIEGSNLSPMSDAAYREWMTSLITYSDPLDQIPDPTQPDWQPAMPGYWNYWGDHLTTFGDAAVTSVWVDDKPVMQASSDPLLGCHVVFNAKIVDLNPADTFCSQFVAASFSVVGTDADGQVSELLRGVPTTSVTRWLNFFRRSGAGSFQAVIPHDSLTFIEEGRAPNSAGLRALREEAAAGGGLLLRWCFYGMAAAQNMMQMYDAFSEGNQAMNPKVGRVVGSIGVWDGTDLKSVPVGRQLMQPIPPFFPPPSGSGSAAGVAPFTSRIRVKTHGDVERLGTEGTQLHALSSQLDCAQAMGPAAAVVEGDRVILDLNTAFPEEGCKAGTKSWAKHDFGTVNLELSYQGDAGPVISVLGAVAYDEQTYETLGGVWEVGFDPSSEDGRHITDGSLRLTDASGRVLLEEVQAVQVVTDDQAVYLDLDKTETGYEAHGIARVRVFRKGKPAADPFLLKVELWRDVQNPGKANSLDPLVVTATEITEKAIDSFEIEVPAGGEIDVPIYAEAPACYKLRYIAPGMYADPANPNWSAEYWSGFRVLPHDDYSPVPDSEITFDFVYREVFSYYSILFPIMSKIIPWGPKNTPNDPERVAQFASLILYATDESRLGTALEMPITRELSAGKRNLLHRWCRLQLQS
jgi:hypothetical protein